MVHRNTRKEITANSLYSSFSLPNIRMIGKGKHSKQIMAIRPTHASAVIMTVKIRRTRSWRPAP